MNLSEESCRYILRARQMVMEDKYDKAFDILVAAFQRVPSLIPIHETEFCAVLLMLNTMLDSADSLPIIFGNFAKALQLFPNNPLLLNDIGKYLYKYGCYKEAMQQFEEVLIISPRFANAEKNLNSIKNLLVERWHYRMLNDNLRNECYRRAIHETVTAQDKVLDVGTGTGVLALYANEAGASRIIGCDGSKVMCNLADSIVRGNKIRNITILNKMSTQLTQWNLGSKFSVLVTEMFDAGLFGEHVLQMLCHAWPAFLTAQAKVVPNSAEFFVAAVQCDHLSINYKLTNSAKSLLNIPTQNVHVIETGESYDCEDVHLVKDIKYLTEPKSVLKIDFNSPQDIVAKLRRTEPFQVDLTAKENGVMNIVIGWFNLYLSETVTITTNPTVPDRANAWQQAVFFDDIPRMVLGNETINLKFLMNRGNLTMAPTCNSPISRASPEIIRFLNDNDYTNMIMSSVPLACDNLTKSNVMSELNILDLCPFPLFGLKMLKNGAKSLTCCAANNDDRNFIVNVFSENNIALSKVSFLNGDDWTDKVIEGRFHVIFNHSLELCGDINVKQQQVVDQLREHHLHKGGLFLPNQLKLITQLVSSHWLDLNNRLYDENVSDYITMARYLNKYKVTQNFAIDFSTLKHVPISDPVHLTNYPTAVNCKEKQVPVISNGFANAILCWYSIELLENMQEISTNRANSFINGMLFLTYSADQLVAGTTAKIVFYQDTDGSFKLVMKSP